MTSNLPPGVSQKMIDDQAMSDEDWNDLYTWFEENIQPTLEGTPSFDDLNTESQQEFIDQYWKEKHRAVTHFKHRVPKKEQTV